jgi:hypothetical protein
LGEGVVGAKTGTGSRYRYRIRIRKRTSDCIDVSLDSGVKISAGW